MTFGDYHVDHCLHIEKSQTYKQINKGNDGVKMAEFLLLRPKSDRTMQIWVVEAKSSAPQPGNHQDFGKYIDEIREKMTNALILGISMCLKRHAEANAELPASFKAIDFSSMGFGMLLVVRGHQKEWLPPMNDALKKVLRPTCKAWALPEKFVEVINDDMARNKGFIL